MTQRSGQHKDQDSMLDESQQNNLIVCQQNQSHEDLVVGEGSPRQDEDEEINQYENVEDQYENQYADMDLDQYQNYYDLEYQQQNAPNISNQQMEQEQLYQLILKEVHDLQQFTNFGFDWNFLYYYTCGWEKTVCIDKIDVQQTHKQLIQYTPQFVQTQAQSIPGDCQICCTSKTELFRNICGHLACILCWTNYIKQRLMNSTQDPFPSCPHDKCKTLISPKLIFFFAEGAPKIMEFFKPAICRSYSTYNKETKVCRGRPGVECCKVFKIKKLFDMIQCNNCGNFVCPRCGEEAHGNSECFDNRNWKKITQDSIQFVEMYSYKECPQCHMAVQRRLGCNIIQCVCKQKFCFICGEGWLPNHSITADIACYRYQEIKALLKEKKEMRKNAKSYFLKIEKRKSMMDRLNKVKDRVFEFKINFNERMQILVINYSFYGYQLDFIKEVCDLQMRALLHLSGWHLSLYFRPNQLQDMQCDILNNLTDNIRDFLLYTVEEQLRAHEGNIDENKMKTLLSEEGKKKFIEKYKEFKKQWDTIKGSLQNFLFNS